MDYKGKKVLILGLGLNAGGVGAARFFSNAGAKVKVTDLKKEEDLKHSLDQLAHYHDISYTLGQHLEEDVDWADLVIKNTAIKPGNWFVEYALKKGKEVETDVGIFLKFVSPQQMIGVTGTKGKTTTASLIFYAVKNKYPNLVLAGNIGLSVLDALENINSETLVILEISSFQLQTFDEKGISPHFAVITNIMPDHLNYHKNMEEYTAAKRVIAKYQTESDFLFLNSSDQTINSEQFLKDLKGQIIKVSAKDLPADFKPNLPGEHNLINYAAALAVALRKEISPEEAIKGMGEFLGAEYRLQKIYEKEGITIINDSASTNPDSGIAALKTYPNSVLIAGGMNKGLNYSGFASSINASAKSVYLIEGDISEELRKGIDEAKFKGVYSDLGLLVSELKKDVKPGDTVLFSPGATSFNLFQNEFDRGRRFTKAVEKEFE